MLDSLENIFDISQYRTKIEQQEALFVYVASTVMLVLVSAYFFLIPDSGINGDITRFQDALNGSAISIFIMLFFYSFIPFIFVATHRGQLIVSGISIMVLWYVLAFVPVFLGSRNMVHPTNALSLCILIVISGLILHERGLIAGTSIALLTLLFNFDPESITLVPVMVSQLAGTSIFVYMYIRYASASRVDGAEVANSERVKLANITTEIASLTLNRTGLNDVLKNGLDLIQQGYPQFYHAQVFLLDDTGRNAQLVSSTGDIGRTLIQQRHSIGVGSQSVIGQATLRNIHVIAQTTDQSAVHQRNEFLPSTVLEAAFPLRVGNQVIGALDLQSKLNFELTEGDLFTYQSLANSVALSIDNVRQFETATQRIQENQQLAEQARQALKEVDRLNKRLMEQAWSEYLYDHEEHVGLNIDFESNTTEENTAWTSALTQALEDGNLIQSINEDERVIAIPLKIRGQVIGAMEFELGEDGNIDPNDLNLIQEVSERFGLAAENARLVEESQRVAQREALINEIGSRLQATNNIESTLTEAVRSLNNILNANRVSIKLRESDRKTSENGSI